MTKAELPASQLDLANVAHELPVGVPKEAKRTTLMI